MVETLTFIGLVAAFEVLSARFAINSRDGEDWTERYGPHLTVGS